MTSDKCGGFKCGVAPKSPKLQTRAELKARELGAFTIRYSKGHGLKWKTVLWPQETGARERADRIKARELVAWLIERSYPRDSGSIGPVPFMFPCGPVDEEYLGVIFIDKEGKWKCKGNGETSGSSWSRERGV